MTVIRVNPASVQGYGRQAQTLFNDMHQSLVALVDQSVEVHYFGNNATQFKTKCGQMATQFAASLHKDLAGMAEAVRVSTSNIAGSLGGAPITIQVDPKPITAPAVSTVDYVDLDTSALEGLAPQVSSKFTAIRTSLSSNASALAATDWKGTAKENAVTAVQGLTRNAVTKCDEAEKSITAYIKEQVSNSIKADA